MITRFRIKGLDCANCAAELEREIEKIDGIDKASISFMAERMEIEFCEYLKEKIIDNLKKVIKKEEPNVTIEEI